MPSCACTPSRQFWSFWPAEWGRKLIVGLFTQTVAISPQNWELYSPLSLPVSFPGGVWLWMLLKWSVSHLYVLWSSGLTPLHLLAPRVLLSVQSDSSFDPIWFLLRENGLDSLCVCATCLSNCIWYIYCIYIKSSIWGTDWMCCCQFTNGILFFSYEGHCSESRLYCRLHSPAGCVVFCYVTRIIIFMLFCIQIVCFIGISHIHWFIYLLMSASIS